MIIGKKTTESFFQISLPMVVMDGNIIAWLCMKIKKFRLIYVKNTQKTGIFVSIFSSHPFLHGSGDDFVTAGEKIVRCEGGFESVHTDAVDGGTEAFL